MKKKLILEYREIESELKAKTKNIKNLSKKSKIAKSELDKALNYLKETEKVAKSRRLTDIKKIEDTKRDVEIAKNHAENHKQVVSNVEFAIKNETESIQKLGERKANTERNIWCEYRETLRAEIREILNDRIERLWTSIICAAPGTLPAHFGFPDDLNKYMGQKKYTKMRKRILSEILNGNKHEGVES